MGFDLDVTSSLFGKLTSVSVGTEAYLVNKLHVLLFVRKKQLSITCLAVMFHDVCTSHFTVGVTDLFCHVDFPGTIYYLWTFIEGISKNVLLNKMISVALQANSKDVGKRNRLNNFCDYNILSGNQIFNLCCSHLHLMAICRDCQNVTLSKRKWI